MSTTAKTLAKGTAWGLIAELVVKFAGWFYYVALARLVSTVEIGIFFLALSIIDIVVLFSSLGLGAGGVGRYVPFYAGKKQFNHVRKVVHIAVIAGGIFSLVCASAVFLSAGELAEFFQTPGLSSVFYIMAVYIIVYNFYKVSLNFLNGRKLIKLSSQVSSLQGVAKLVLTILLILAISATANSIALGFIASFALAAIVSWYWVIREYKRLPKSYEQVDGYGILKEMIPFGLTLVTLASMAVINSQFDRIMLGYYLPAEINTHVIGIYSVVIGFSSLITIFTASIGGIFYPMITEFWGGKNTAEIEKASTVFIRWMLLSTTPVLLMILVFSREVLTIIYGITYREGYLALILYTIGLFIYSFSNPIQYALSAMKKLDFSLKVVGFGALVNISLNLVFIPLYGMEGAAFTSLTSFTLMALLFFSIRRTTYIKIPKNISRQLIAGLITLISLIIIKPFIGGLLEFIPVFASGDVMMDILRKFLKLCIIGGLFCITGVIYFTSVIFLKALENEDIDIMLEAMRRMDMPRWLIGLTQKILYSGRQAG
ncbi:MAG: oligosaccharide flippase family protein [Candidatus Altiarchaeota archaeon]|nr:oligosaccharide flippase family protein [Candidatus Altiarchaeota archaeon]